MRTVIDSYNPGGIDAAVLRGTGPGGILARGFLREDPLESYLGDDEEPVIVRSNRRKGVSAEHLDGTERERIVPGRGYRAFALATDARLLFVVGDTRTGDGDRSVSIPLADVELVDAGDGLRRTTVEVTTRSDVRWRFPCTADVDDLLAYLDEATAAWKRLESDLETARRRVVDAGQHRADSEYGAAMDALETAAAATATARRRERAFAPAGVAAMASRIERTRERVGEARRATLRARASHRVDRAERLWREEAYAAAHETFVEAREDFAAALESHEGSEPAASLREQIDHVERSLDALERSPVERARQTLERADEADDLVERSALLERALDRYRRALALDWGTDDARFAGDTAEIRDRVDAVASDLVAARRRLAVQRVDAGDRHRAAGRTELAADRYREARDLLDATLDVARELVPDAADSLAECRAAVDRRLAALEDGTDPAGRDARATDTGGSARSAP